MFLSEFKKKKRLQLSQPATLLSRDPSANVMHRQKPVFLRNITPYLMIKVLQFTHFIVLHLSSSNPTTDHLCGSSRTTISGLLPGHVFEVDFGSLSKLQPSRRWNFLLRFPDTWLNPSWIQHVAGFQREQSSRRASQMHRHASCFLLQTGPVATKGSTFVPSLHRTES